MEPDKVDSILAAKVVRDAREARDRVLARYATIPSAELIDVLKARGYEVKRYDEPAAINLDNPLGLSDHDI